MKKIQMRFPGGLGKTLTLSYDDGFRDDLQLLEIMQKYGIKGTFNLNSGLFETSRMPADQTYKAFANSGMEVAAHGYLHLPLDSLTEEEIEEEILKDRACLEALFAQPITGMAYAYGQCSEKVVNVLRKTGIVYSRTVGRTAGFGFPEDWLLLHPTCHHDDPELENLTDTFLAAVPEEPMMFYLWGHSGEFTAHNNWERMESFCQKIGGKPDIWYATNIEIYRYVKAFESLIFSAEYTYVQNPSAFDIWFEKDGNVFCVKSGETLSL